MQALRELKVGSTVNVQQGSRIYKTVVVNKDIKNKLLHIETPISKLRKLKLHKNKDYILSYTSSRHGIFVAKVKFLTKKEGYPVVLVKKAKKQQKREYFRVSHTGYVKLSKIDIEANAVQNEFEEDEMSFDRIIYRDISLGGVGLLSKTKYELDSNIYIKLPTPNGPVKLIGTVVRASKANEGKYAIGVEFIRFISNNKSKLNDFILKIQRDHMKRS